MAITMAISAVISKKLQKPLTYEQLLALFKADLWKQAIDEEMQAFKDNFIWQIMDLPSDTKILDRKWVYRIKQRVDSKLSRYKARWVAKNYKQIYSINSN